MPKIVQAKLPITPLSRIPNNILRLWDITDEPDNQVRGNRSYCKREKGLEVIISDAIKKTRPPKQVPHYENMDKVDTEREVREVLEELESPISPEYLFAKLSHKFIPEDALNYYEYRQIPEQRIEIYLDTREFTNYRCN